MAVSAAQVKTRTARPSSGSKGKLSGRGAAQGRGARDSAASAKSGNTYTVTLRSNGKTRTVEIQAANPELARRQARRLGTVVGVTRAKASAKSGMGMSASERYTFLVRLATMLASKVGATEALRLLRDSFGGSISRCASGLLDKLELGTELALAIAEDKKNFPGAVGLIIKVGAATGQTYRALQEAAEFERKLTEVRKGAGKGIIGAVLGFIFGAGMMIASTMVIGPEIQSMSIMQAAGDEIDTGLIDGIAFWSGLVMIVMVAFTLALLWLATVGRLMFPKLADAIIMRIPYYNEIVLAQENYIALHRLQLLVRSGVRMEDSLRASYEAVRPGALKEDFRRALDNIQKGQKWAAAMHSLHPTDRAALLLASDRDQIAQNLENVAQQLQTLYMQRLSVLAPTLQVASAIAVTLSGVVLFGVSILPMLQASVGIISG